MEGHRLQSTAGDNDGPDGVPCPSYDDWENGLCDDDEWPDSSFTEFELELRYLDTSGHFENSS